ncbi:MAG: hypothetical protein ACLU0O_01050 [Collinsella sp.]
MSIVLRASTVIRGTRQASRSLELLRLRVDPMHERYSALLERASDWAARLRDQPLWRGGLRFAQEDHRGCQGEVARAKERVDTASAAQNEFKVARGKLEVQVEAAIKAITADGTTVLEEALMLPAPTDRDAAERELNQLVRQINNLGPVNKLPWRSTSSSSAAPITSRSSWPIWRARARRSPRSRWPLIARCGRPSW